MVVWPPVFMPQRLRGLWAVLWGRTLLPGLFRAIVLWGRMDDFTAITGGVSVNVLCWPEKGLWYERGVMTSGVLFWVWLCFIGLALFFLVMACGAWMSLNRESQQAWMSWQRRLKRHDGDMSVSPEFFIRTYKRVYAPRGFAYAGIFSGRNSAFYPIFVFSS